MATVEQKRTLNFQIRLDPFLLFILTSVLVHGIGLLIFAFSNRSRLDPLQTTKPTPINFVVVPPEESLDKPPPETKNRAVENSVAKGEVKPELPSATDKISTEEAIATPKPSPATKPELPAKPSASVIPQTPPLPKTESVPQSEPKLVEPPPSLSKEPKQEIAPTPPVIAKKPKPIPKLPPLSGSSSNSIPQAKPEIDRPTATNTKPELPPVATNLPPQPKPLPSPATENPSVPPSTPTPSPEQETPVGSGSASLLGGTYRKTHSEDSERSFFSPQASASQAAINPSGADARQDLNLGPYFAEIRRRVKRNWKPSSTSNNRHTVLAFSIQRNGQITGLRVTQTSGSQQADRASLEAVQKSAPFAALPANFPNELLNVEFNFNIYVHQGVITPQLENWQRF